MNLSINGKNRVHKQIFKDVKMIHAPAKGYFFRWQILVVWSLKTLKECWVANYENGIFHVNFGNFSKIRPVNERSLGFNYASVSSAEQRAGQTRQCSSVSAVMRQENRRGSVQH